MRVIAARTAALGDETLRVGAVPTFAEAAGERTAPLPAHASRFTGPGGRVILPLAVGQATSSPQADLATPRQPGPELQGVRRARRARRLREDRGGRRVHRPRGRQDHALPVLGYAAGGTLGVLSPTATRARAIVRTVRHGTAMNLPGDGLRDALDPQLKV